MMAEQEIYHNLVTHLSGLQDRINLLEARVLVERDDLKRMSNTISEQAAEIHKIVAQQETDRLRMDDFDVRCQTEELK